MKRKMKMYGNFVSETMLQPLSWLNFSAFDGRLKIENDQLKSIFNYCFSAKTLQIVDRTTPEGWGGVHSHGIICPQPHPHRSATLP